MSFSHTRRDVLGLCGIAITLGTTGCLSASSRNTDSQETNAPKDTSSRSQTPVTTSDAHSTTSDRTTIATSALPDKEVKERALTAEEKYLTEQLQSATCLTNWGTASTTMEKQATITKRTPDGVYVKVTHPYSYSTKDTEADGGSNALYIVTPDSIRRVRGDSVSPC